MKLYPFRSLKTSTNLSGFASSDHFGCNKSRVKIFFSDCTYTKKLYRPCKINKNFLPDKCVDTLLPRRCPSASLLIRFVRENERVLSFIFLFFFLFFYSKAILVILYILCVGVTYVWICVWVNVRIYVRVCVSMLIFMSIFVCAYM